MQTSRFGLLIVAFLLGACAGPGPYKYQFIPGKSAVVGNDGYAIPPKNAPEPVLLAIAAGNRIAGMPYKYGGGHRSAEDTGYDCSGSASYVLRAAGLMRDSMPSSGFRHFGENGKGEWISVYARRDHTFLVIAGLRFDTGYGETRGQGPRWSDHDRPTSGAVVRHPRGL